MRVIVPIHFEERTNSISHGIGIVLSIIGLIVMLPIASLHGDAWRIISTSIYCGSLVLLYSISTLYHSVKSPKINNILKILDHSSIYLLIAGSYTPFVLVNFRGAWGWSMFGVVWGIAFFGIIFKVFINNHIEWVSTLLYVIMGWLIVITQAPIAEVLDWYGFIWLLVGGLFYTGGVAFFTYDRIPYFHTIWHVFVILGSLCHYYAIMMYVLPI